MYDAFISYNHYDSHLADELQRSLQKYAKPWYKIRSINVFRDQTNLSASPGLWTSIKRDLLRSKHMVLLASPKAACSKWVQKEVCVWLTKGACEEPSEFTIDQIDSTQANRLFIVLASGQIAWDTDLNDFDWTSTDALPMLLSKTFQEEPSWLDMGMFIAAQREDVRIDTRFNDAVAKLSAPLQGKSLETLIRHDYQEHRRTMRTVVLALVTLGVLLVAASSFGIFAYGQYLTAEANRVEAERRASLARSQRLAIESAEVLDSNTTLSLLLSAEAVQNSVDAGEYVSQAYQALHQSILAAQVPVRRIHSSEISDIALSADGQFIASAAASWIADNGDNRIGIWRSDAFEYGPQRTLVTNSDGVSQAELPGDGSWLFAGDLNGNVAAWDLTKTDPSPKRLGSMESSIDRLYTDQDANWLLAVDRRASPLLWNIESLPEVANPYVLKHDEEVVAGTIDPSGKWAATADYLRGDYTDEILRVWDLEDSNPTRDPIVVSFDGPAFDLVTGFYGTLLAAVGGNQLTLWQVLDDEGNLDVRELPILEGHRQSVTAAAVHPTRQLIATADWEGGVYVWNRNPEGDFDRIIVSEFDRPIYDLQFIPETNYLGLIVDGDAHLVNLSKPEFNIPSYLPPAFQNFVTDANDIEVANAGGEVSTITISGSSGQFVVGSKDGSVSIYNMDRVGFEDPRIWVTTQLLGWPDGWQRGQFEIDPTGRWVMTTRNNSYELAIFDTSVPTNDPVPYAYLVDQRPGIARDIAFTPNGRWLVLNTNQNLHLDIQGFAVANLEKSKDQLELHTLSINEQVSSYGISDSGALVALGGQEGEIGIWDLTGDVPRLVDIFESGFSEPIYDINIFDEGNYVFSKNEDGVTRLHVGNGEMFVEAQLSKPEASHFPIAQLEDGAVLARNDIGELRCWQIDPLTRRTSLSPISSTGPRLEDISDIVLSHSKEWMVTYRTEDGATDGSSARNADLWRRKTPCSYHWVRHLEHQSVTDNEARVQFSHDGQWLANRAELIRLEESVISHSLPVPGAPSGEFSIDSRWYVSHGDEGIVLYDLFSSNVAQSATVVAQNVYRDFRTLPSLSVSRAGYVHWEDWTRSYRVPINWPELRSQAMSLTGRSFTDAEWSEYLPYPTRRDVFQLGEVDASEQVSASAP